MKEMGAFIKMTPESSLSPCEETMGSQQSATERESLPEPNWGGPLISEFQCLELQKRNDYSL